mgnify:CR=1 FL=1
MRSNNKPSRRKKKRGRRILIPLLLLVLLLGAGILYQSVFPIRYESQIEKYATEYGVDVNLVYAVINTESGFDKDVVSPAGAVGLMQVTKDTGEFIAKKMDLADFQTEDLKDPEKNIRMGVFYLSYLMTLYDNEISVLAAYNAGPNRVKTWLGDPAYSTGGVLTEIPFPETRDYVERVMFRQKVYRALYFFK